MKYIFFISILVVGMIGVSCSNDNNSEYQLESEVSIEENNEIASLDNFYNDLQTKSLESISDYLNERINKRSQIFDETVETGLRTTTLSASQQIIQNEYVTPYFVKETVSGISTIVYKGNFNFQSLINDSRLSLSDREIILAAFVNIEQHLPLEPVPLGPGGLAVQYCLDMYRWECLQIAYYYFTCNLMTIAPIIQDFLAASWNIRLGRDLVTNNHQRDIDAAKQRYNNCLNK
jgi:hypothetical protein